MVFALIESKPAQDLDYFSQRRPLIREDSGVFFIAGTYFSNITSFNLVFNLEYEVIDQSIIRKRIQAERAALDKNEQVTFSLEICQQILQGEVLSNAEHIAFYLPVRGEADPSYLQTFEALADKKFYLPILSATKQHHLEFALYNETTPMKMNRFKILEPDIKQSELLSDPKQLDAVIMPLVAIDNKGNRIGMGGGFYDRTFAFRKNEQCKPHLIGFAYDFQLIDKQTPQQWDIPTDSIALQSNYISINQ